MFHQFFAGSRHEWPAHVPGASLHRPPGVTWQTLLQVSHMTPFGGCILLLIIENGFTMQVKTVWNLISESNISGVFFVAFLYVIIV